MFQPMRCIECGTITTTLGDSCPWCDVEDEKTAYEWGDPLLALQSRGYRRLEVGEKVRINDHLWTTRGWVVVTPDIVVQEVAPGNVVERSDEEEKPEPEKAISTEQYTGNLPLTEEVFKRHEALFQRLVEYRDAMPEYKNMTRLERVARGLESDPYGPNPMEGITSRIRNVPPTGVSVEKEIIIPVDDQWGEEFE